VNCLFFAWVSHSAWFGSLIDVITGFWTGHVYGSAFFCSNFMVVHYVYGHGMIPVAFKGYELSTISFAGCAYPE
jgi:hypothetical protein